MAAKKKPAARKPRKKKTRKRFSFQLDYGGVAGIAVVIFCLFLWMFLLGIWAGQTILLPSPPGDGIKADHKNMKQNHRNNLPVKILRPEGRKTPVTRR